jgi:peptidyl-prolyl cis-trans isomerase C
MKGITRWICAALASGALWGLLSESAIGQRARTPAPAPAEIPADRTIATVNGEPILYGRLAPVLKDAAPDPLSEKQRRETAHEALNLLIDDVLVRQYLQKYVPPIPKSQVDKQMTEILSGEKDRALAELCKGNNHVQAELRASITEHLQWMAYADKYVSEAQLQTYYQLYKDFFDKVIVRASHIFIRLAPEASESDRAAARAKLQNLRAQILQGKLDFAVAARTHSQCYSAPSGGDVGSFPRKFVVEESFARAAFALKPGEISDVVQTQLGLHLIKVTERTPGTPSEFTKIKSDVRGFYLEDLRQTIVTQMRKSARIEILLH